MTNAHATRILEGLTLLGFELADEKLAVFPNPLYEKLIALPEITEADKAELDKVFGRSLTEEGMTDLIISLFIDANHSNYKLASAIVTKLNNLQP